MFPYFYLFGKQLSVYGVCMVIAITLVFLLSMRSAQKKQILWEDILVVTAFAIGFGLVFAKLMYLAVTYSFSEMVCFIINQEFTFIQTGGLVFYGGLLGGVFGAVLACSFIRINLYDLEHAVVPYLPFGHAIGRIGCLFAGCCYGVEYSGPLHIRYPLSLFGLSAHSTYFPVQLLEAGLDVLLAIYLCCIAEIIKKRFHLLYLYLFWYGIVRFMTEFFRGDIVRGVYYGFSTAQWISILLILFCSCQFYIFKKSKKVE